MKKQDENAEEGQNQNEAKALIRELMTLTHQGHRWGSEGEGDASGDRDHGDQHTLWR